MLRNLIGTAKEFEGYIENRPGLVLEGKGIKDNNPYEFAAGTAIDNSQYGGMGGFGGPGFNSTIGSSCCEIHS